MVPGGSTLSVAEAVEGGDDNEKAEKARNGRNIERLKCPWESSFLLQLSE